MRLEINERTEYRDTDISKGYFKLDIENKTYKEYVPTNEEVAIKEAKEAEYKSFDYQRLRKAEYDKLNQDELRFDDLENGTTTWQDAINAIKAMFPKPE